jgi:hypothetical protein
MAMDEIGMIFPLCGVPNPYRHQRHDHTTMADGGKGTRLDAMIDDDGPLPEKGGAYAERQAVEAAHLKERKEFCVTPKTRFGGTGLYHGPDKEEE